MRPFFKYIGSKWNLARSYGIPQHDVVVEPFAGSAGYSVYWNSRKTILVDRNPVICGLWNFLINATANDIMSIPSDIDDIDQLRNFPQEVRDLVGFWLSRSDSTPRQRITPSNKRWRDEVGKIYWGDKVKNRITSQLENIREWRVVEGDYADAPDIEAQWFVDPPYQMRPGLYKVKFSDYEALAEFCRNRKGTVDVAEMEGADWLPFKVIKRIKNQKNGKYNEVVWSSRSSASSLLVNKPGE